PGEIGLDRALHEAEARRHLLDHPGGLELHVDHHAREAVVELVEADDSAMRHPARRLPCDAVVLAALGDPAFPLTLAEPDLFLPADPVAALLLDAQHPVHELRVLVELRPRLVGLLHGNRHVGPPLNGKTPRLLPASSAASERLRESLADHAAASLETVARALRDVLAELPRALFAFLLGRAGEPAQQLRAFRSRHRTGRAQRGGRQQLLALEGGDDALRSSTVDSFLDPIGRATVTASRHVGSTSFLEI